MSKDLRWDAIHHIESRYGSLGLRHFKLLRWLGCGDIGTVYLAELSGTNCLLALKVMYNEFIASRKKIRGLILKKKKSCKCWIILFFPHYLLILLRRSFRI
ncbi:hypothetical protein MKX01_009798 [Papaver californicum]|nr:hypothetical protein MKX01_009798 [Papaver californicum]